MILPYLPYLVGGVLVALAIFCLLAACLTDKFDGAPIPYVLPPDDDDEFIDWFASRGDTGGASC